MGEGLETWHLFADSVFLNKIFIALFSDGEREITSLVIFCGCLKCMTSNDKKSMDMILKLCLGQVAKIKP